MEQLISYSDAIKSMYNGTMIPIARDLSSSEIKCIDLTLAFYNNNALPDMSELTNEDVFGWFQFVDQWEFKDCRKALCVYQSKYYRSLIPETSRTMIIVSEPYSDRETLKYVYLVPNPEYIPMFQEFINKNGIVESARDISHLNYNKDLEPTSENEHYDVIDSQRNDFFNKYGGQGYIFQTTNNIDSENIFNLKWLTFTKSYTTAYYTIHQYGHAPFGRFIKESLDSPIVYNYAIVDENSLIQFVGRLSNTLNTRVNSMGYHIDEVHYTTSN